jgi:hypothetical protein
MAGERGAIVDRGAHERAHDLIQQAGPSRPDGANLLLASGQDSASFTPADRPLPATLLLAGNWCCRPQAGLHLGTLNVSTAAKAAFRPRRSECRRLRPLRPFGALRPVAARYSARRSLGRSATTGLGDASARFFARCISAVLDQNQYFPLTQHALRGIPLVPLLAPPAMADVDTAPGAKRPARGRREATRSLRRGVLQVSSGGRRVPGRDRGPDTSTRPSRAPKSTRTASRLVVAAWSISLWTALLSVDFARPAARQNAGQFRNTPPTATDRL